MSAYDESRAAGGRYSNVSIALHWTTAFLLAVQIPLGLSMEQLQEGSRQAAVQVHKSMGITILLLTLLRLGWRLGRPWPPLIPDMARWERLLARGTHVGFYFGLLATPLAGWSLVSASPRAPEMRFWGAPFFTLPWPRDRDLAEFFAGAHSALVWMTLLLLALHIAGALKHHFVQNDETLWRMAPIFPRPKRRGPNDPPPPPEGGQSRI